MRKGFTLIELLVVVSIIALLISILLPVVGKVQYSANITKCKVALRSIATVQVAYAVDNKQIFPAGRPRYEGGGGWTTARDAGAQVRSWEIFKNGTNGYDLRPIYYDYLQNNNQDAVMHCPLVSERFLENNRDDRILSYMLYTSNNYRVKHFYYEDVGAYETTDQTWSPEGEHDAEFTILASDFAFGNYAPFGVKDENGQPYRGALSAHPAPNGYIYEQFAEINDGGGYVLAGSQTAPINYADIDLSVQAFKINDGSYQNKNDWVVNSHSRGKDALMPREMAK